MKATLPLKAAPLDDDEFEAWLQGRVPRRLLAIPFGGPIPSPKSRLGVDLDGEYFDERTDIYGPHAVLARVRERLVDWHHRAGPQGKMAGGVIGKAILDDEPDEDGWWVDLWLKAGEARVALIRRLAARGAQLFGSSEPVQASVRKAADGHIEVWPFLFETISTSPQNTLSVMRPAKARLDDALAAGLEVNAGLAALLTGLPLDDLDPTSQGEDLAKAGRELSRINEETLEAALQEISAGAGRLQALVERIRLRYRREPSQAPARR